MPKLLVLVVGWLCIAVLARAMPGHAETPLLEMVPPAFRHDYGALLANPDDLDRIYALATRAEQAALEGDADAAALARLALRLYERMLLINPELGEIRLRLGELNYGLGRYETARAYLTEVLDDPDLPAPVRAGVDAYLDSIAARISRHRLAGSLLVGLRHQTNANAAPPNGSVVIEGDSVDLGEQFRPRSDQDLFGSLDLVHSYDLDLQAGQTIETRVSAYGAKQFKEDEVDTFSLDVSSGVRWPLAFEGLPGTSIRPHVVARTLAFGGDLFSVDVGGGLDISQALGETISSTAELQIVQQFHPDDSDRDGPGYSALFGLRFRPRPWLEFGATPVIRYDDARRAGRANLRYGATLGVWFAYPAPFGIGVADWSTSFRATWLQTHFEGPDESAGAGASDREDELYRLQLANQVPIANRWSLLASVAYTRNDSNVDLREFDNWEFSIGVAWSF